MNADDVVQVRYAPGVVGETRRVVHVAIRRPDGACAALCELVIEAAEAELLDGPAGMPCLVCVRALALGSGGAPVELDAEASR
ncbi:hypothetical protein [Saccharopolyspora gregorii]|uniref:hypothetical protein n=1 Tax=Saccharopolyspora gregorii TaxID=33914 RepID=UPI0021AD42D5|nr:hypothetical protein [Saccharopolyspora gregorii]